MSEFLKDITKSGSTKIALISSAITSIPSIICAVKDIANSDVTTRKRCGKALGYGVLTILGTAIAYKVTSTICDIVKHHFSTKDDGELYTIERTADAIYEKAKDDSRKRGTSGDDDDDQEDDEDDLDSDTLNLSDIPHVDGLQDDHQLVGKLLHREDICLCYGEEHIAKTSIIFNWIIDIVLQRKARLIPDDQGVHTPYHCIWYNGEMNQTDLHVFFGDFNRKLLDGKIEFVENFAHLDLKGWLKNVEKRLRRCSEDSIVVLDNMSCISNSTGSEVRNMKNRFLALQKKIYNDVGIHVTFIIIDHINKKGEVAGSYKLMALFSNRIRFCAYGEGHTKVTVEKKHTYHEMIHKSFDLKWTTSPEGFKSFQNIGEIVEKKKPSADTPPLDNNYADVDDVDDGKKYSDDQILEFHRIFQERGNQSEAQRQTGVPRQVYQKRIAKILENGADS